MKIEEVSYMKIAICLMSNPILKMAYAPYEPSSMLLRSVVLKDPTARGQLSDVGHVSGKKKKSQKTWGSCLIDKIFPALNSDG